jgi:hypothetical protein
VSHPTPDALVQIAHYGLSVAMAIAGTIFVALGVVAHRRSAPGAGPDRAADTAAPKRDP